MVKLIQKFKSCVLKYILYTLVLCVLTVHQNKFIRHFYIMAALQPGQHLPPSLDNILKRGCVKMLLLLRFNQHAVFKKIRPLCFLQHLKFKKEKWSNFFNIMGYWISYFGARFPILCQKYKNSCVLGLRILSKIMPSCTEFFSQEYI